MMIKRRNSKMKQKVYKPHIDSNINMLPGDRNGSPDESLIFLDEGFLYKLSKYLSKGKSLKFDRITFSKNLAEKEKFCKKIFYYNAPPFQSDPPTKEEELRKEGYDKFIKKIKRNKEIVVREGRCQRLKIDGQFVFKQKAVDVFLAMDLTNVPIKYPNVKRIILISSDSDFIPVIKNIEIEQQGVKTILYTYYEKKRNANFSRSNELIKSVYKYVLLNKKDFTDARLKKEVENDKK